MGTGVEARREGGCMGGTVMRCRPRTCTHLQYLPCSVRSPPQVPAPGVRRAQRTALHAIGTRMAGPTEREMPRARAPPGSQRQRRDHNDNVDCGDVIMTARPPNSKPPQLTKTLKNLGTDHSPLKTHTAVTLLGKRVPPPGPPPATETYGRIVHTSTHARHHNPTPAHRHPNARVRHCERKLRTAPEQCDGVPAQCAPVGSPSPGRTARALRSHFRTARLLGSSAM